MSVQGLCQICEARPASERCENCGALTCQVHYERGPGLCADCAAQARPGRDPNRDDVDTYRF